MVLVVFCSPLVKPPTKVEAVAIPVVAGAAIVAAAMSALGIGVAAGFDTQALAEGAQKVWDDLDESVRKTVVLTEMAGTTVAHFSEQALRDIFSGLQTAFPQNATDNPVYSHEGAFSTAQEMTNWFSQLGIDNASYMFDSSRGNFYVTSSDYLSLSMMQNFRVVGFYSLPDTVQPYNFSIPDGTLFKFSVDGDRFSYRYPENPSGVIKGYSSSRHTVDGHGSLNRYFSPSSSFVSLAFDSSNGFTYVLLISSLVAQSTVQLMWYSTALSDVVGSIPAPGQDVFNPADRQFYADGMSTLNNKLDDVLNRLKERVGETGQVSDQPDVITVPANIPDVEVSDKTKAADQAGTIGEDIASAEDKAANDATNADRDTTKPSIPGEDTDIPDLSIPQIITTKFPFSIPWDLYRAVNILVAPAQAPKWELPLHFDMLNVNTTLMIDLSQFDGIAALLRWGLSLLFLISLIILSSTIIRR